MADDLANLFARFFVTKTSCDVAGTMAFFSPDLATYTDATLGWAYDGHAELEAVFEQFMPTWRPPGRSYTTAVLANESSALLRMVDTPELFGGELRILAAVDLEDGKIVRWVDYWDSSSYDDGLYEQYRTPEATFPRDLKDRQVSTRAADEVVAARAGGRPDRGRGVPGPARRPGAVRRRQHAATRGGWPRRRWLRVDVGRRADRHDGARARRRRSRHPRDVDVRLATARPGPQGGADPSGVQLILCCTAMCRPCRHEGPLWSGPVGRDQDRWARILG